jgi:ribosomal protein S18 acetylase RimI-like enzyme
MASEIAARQPIKIEPFDPPTHDRAAFSCGNDQLDNFLKLTAKKHQKDDVSRVFVAVRPGSKLVLGYYSVNSHSITMDQIPESLAKRAPRGRRLPAAYISMFGVDKSVQGKGIGKLLLADCLKRIVRVSDEIGTCAAILDVLDDSNAEAIEKRSRFYQSFGFVSFPSQPLRMFVAVTTLRNALGTGT